MEEEDDDFGGYGSEEPSAETRKKSKAITAKQTSVPTTSAKKTDTKKLPREEAPVSVETVGEDEPPQKRTSSRIQGKSRAVDAPQPTSSTTSKAKPSVKAAKATVESGIATKEDIEDDTEVRSRVKQLEQDLEEIQARLDRRTSERDSYAKQVKDFKDKKASDADKLYEKYKATADSRASAQDQVIDTLQQLNDKLTSRVTSLEKDLKLAKTVKPVEKEMQKQPEVDGDIVKKLKARLQAVEEESKQKDVQLKDYETEVKLARDAIVSTNKKLVTAQSASSITRDAEETAKDADIIKWYEDLTNLVVLSVKVIPGDCGREVTFVCVETLADHTKEDPSKAGSWIYTKQVDYTPIGLEAEKDQAFLSRLDMLKDPFTFTRDQAYAFMANLQEKMSSGEDTEE
ncbi:hypothetical protein QFC22_005383 [Naganishia vaughanmartiniae]|uniref:Uncharacterized protein n=1 Tax=Naganishia vaughanmartiniae TaxID=1424756 RepID=A0ACC2WUR3_9TREE|nr:hypothetical protein QFC22_005383 [Naganishia vaughanmartiniae]